VRDLKNHENRRVQERPIKGEQLHVVGADASDATEVVTWNISRLGGTSHPVLTPLKPEDVYGQSGNIFLIKPVVATMKMTHAHNAG
jgi:hypothetical protein